jgi:hypothetical protein
MLEHERAKRVGDRETSLRIKNLELGEGMASALLSRFLSEGWPGYGESRDISVRIQFVFGPCRQ